MNKKEFTDLIKQLAPHFGEQVACEWLSPSDGEWNKWEKAEINTLFLINLEKGNIRNIRLPQTCVTVRAKFIVTFKTFQEWEDGVSSVSQEYKHREIVCIDQCGKILISKEDFALAYDNGEFPVNVYRMLRNTEE